MSNGISKTKEVTILEILRQIVPAFYRKLYHIFPNADKIENVPEFEFNKF